MAEFAIVEASAEDDAGLMALVSLCPEEGLVKIGYSMKQTPRALNSLLGPRRHFCAKTREGQIVGMACLDLCDVRVGDRMVRSGYLNSLRTHPEWRRRGVATALIAHRAAIAEKEYGAELLWAAVIGGNKASTRTLRHAGFELSREGHAKMVFPKQKAANTQSRAPLRLADATNDLPWIVQRLNDECADLDLWPSTSQESYLAGLSRCTASTLESESNVLAGPGCSQWVWVDSRDRPRAAVLLIDLSDFIGPSILGVNPLVRLVGAALGIPLKKGAPLRTAILTRVVANPDSEDVARSLAQAVIEKHARQFDVVCVFDRSHGAASSVYRKLRGQKIPILLAQRGAVRPRRRVFLEPI